MAKEDARDVRHEVFIRSVLLMGSRTGKLAEVVIVSRGAAAPMGRIMSFVDIPTHREFFEEEQTLTGHTSGVTCMTQIYDGRVVSGSLDKSLVVWTPGGGRRSQRHTDTVECVAQLCDSSTSSLYFVSGSHDNTLILWRERESGAFVSTQILRGHTSSVVCVAQLNNMLGCASFVSGSWDKTLIVWSSGDMSHRRGPWGFVAWEPLFGHTDKVNCVAKIDGGCFVSGSSDNRSGGCFVSGSSDNTLIVWARYDYGEFAASQILTGHTSAVMCVAQLDGRRLVSGSGDKTLIVWVKGDDGMFAAAQTLAGHTESVRCMMQLDDRRIVSGSDDNTLIVWAAGGDGAFAATQTLSGHTGGVWDVAKLDSGRFVSGSEDKTLKVWE